ncbi:DUF6498-containing protein [Microscilla marina]|nr:DUF6498-containing protein [Microscilla marina]
MSLKASKSLNSSVLVLIIVNLVPIFGVIYLQWSVSNVILLYVFETFIVGVFNIFKVVLAGTNKELPGCSNFFLAGFFIIHYNGFIAIQFFFIFDLISHLEKNNGTQEAISREIVPGLTLLGIAYLSIVLSHLYSFVKNYLIAGEYKYTDSGAQMIMPYMRVAVQQLLALSGGYFLASSGNKSMALLVLLVVLKTFFDFLGHLLERSQYKKMMEKYRATQEEQGNNLQ